jgi:hypothetical protein
MVNTKYLANNKLQSVNKLSFGQMPIIKHHQVNEFAAAF